MSDGEIQQHFKPERSATVITSMTMTTSTPHSYVRPQSAGEAGKSTPKLNRSLPDMPDSQLGGSFATAAPNVYPIHLLQTTNYRLPGDVDSHNLERHLTDADFEAVFRMSREDFYQV
jgi:hypothetical protein